jgi:hypothetical protein
MSPGAPAPRAEGFAITSSPVAALTGAALVSGAERADDGDLKVYLGVRYRGVYVLIPPGENADAIERTWDSGVHGHLFMQPAPSGDMLFCDKEPPDA